MGKDRVVTCRDGNKSLKPPELEPMGQREDVGPLVGAIGALQVVSKSNSDECGVKKARTIGGYGVVQ